MKCPECNLKTRGSGINFCSRCGHQFSNTKKGISIGDSTSKGVYRKKYTLIKEFDSRNDAYSLEEFLEYDHIEVKLVRSTVTKNSHPYICGFCYRSVTKFTKGNCRICNSRKWIKHNQETDLKEKNPPSLWPDDDYEDPFLC